ncbi:Outer membrane porin protein 32 precursor [compost metagenome]
MKKRLTAQAALVLALAASGAAHAQSTLTIFGVLDASITSTTNRAQNLSPLGGSVSLSRTDLANSRSASSRLGFMGQEDLGGGMAAAFWLEAPVTNDDGATGIATFSRRSTLSLLGTFGELRVGRDYMPVFVNDVLVDPFSFNGAGAALTFIANTGSRLDRVSRANNSIAYFLPPNLGGFYGQAMYALHEGTKQTLWTTPPPPNSTRTGRHIGARFGYAKGPLDIGVAFGRSTTGDDYNAGTTDEVQLASLGLTYDFNFAKFYAGVNRSKAGRDYARPPVSPLPDVTLNSALIGVTVPVGVGVIRATYSRAVYDEHLNDNRPDPQASKIALGYLHNLSKRTALYATVARLRNKNGAAITIGGPAYLRSASLVPTTSTGYDVGIRHAF